MTCIAASTRLSGRTGFPGGMHAEGAWAACKVACCVAPGQALPGCPVLQEPLGCIQAVKNGCVVQGGTAMQISRINAGPVLEQVLQHWDVAGLHMPQGLAQCIVRGFGQASVPSAPP